MRNLRILLLALMSVGLAACGSDNDDDGDSSSASSVSSVSSVATSSSSVSSVSSAVPPTPSSSSSAASSASVPAETPEGGDPFAGMTLYEDMCADCHWVSGKSEQRPFTSEIRVDAYNFSRLRDYIDDSMPLLATSDCVGQCAEDIAAYLMTWANVEELSCSTGEDHVSYSPRRLRLLTADEYANTVRDLLGVTKDYSREVVSDDFKGLFPNNTTANVDEARANRFWANAEEIAAWAIDNDQPFACTTNADCATPFIEDFAYRAYRRPLTRDEAVVYENIFNNFPGAEGLEAALIKALTSPQFLYRSELGIRVADVLSGEGFEEEYVAVDPTVFSAASFMSGEVSDGFVGGRHYFGGPMPYEFTGNDVVRMRFRTTETSGQSFFVRIDNERFEFELDGTNVRTFTIQVQGITGRVHLHVDSPTNRLYLGDMTAGRAELSVPSKGDEEKLALADPNAYVLTPYEMATYLSYSLTGSTPDAELLEAAANDGLDFPEQVRAQVDRLLDTPAGRRQMGVFAGYWFDTDKVVNSHYNRDNEVHPNYTMEVRASMAEEVRELFRTVFYNDSYTFSDFYGGDFTVVNSILADYYGISAGSTSPSDWRVVDNLEKRGGILTTGAWMTVNSHFDKTSPILRAVHVREQMLCQHIDPPPLLVEDRQHLLEQAEAEYQAGTLTSRGYYEIITDARSCDGCHLYQINPMFGMEDFDNVGQWRSTERGSTGMALDVDTTGYLYGPENVTDTSTRIPFDGAKDLSKVLSTLPGTHACLVEKAFRYTTGMPIKDRAVDTDYEPPLTAQQRVDFACAAEQAESALMQTGSPREVMTELMLQDFVRFRKAD